MSGSVKPDVLFVDDEKDITSVLKMGLEKHGFNVDAFNDPKKALLQFKKGHYDAIVLDIRMPGMSGFDLAKKIWEKDQTARVCFLSSFEIYENEGKKVFTNFKAHCFIKKPMTPSALAQHVQSHLIAK